MKIRVNKANIYMYLKFYTKYLSTTKFMSAGDRWLEKFLETNLDVNKMKKRTSKDMFDFFKMILN